MHVTSCKLTLCGGQDAQHGDELRRNDGSKTTVRLSGLPAVAAASNGPTAVVDWRPARTRSTQAYLRRPVPLAVAPPNGTQR